VATVSPAAKAAPAGLPHSPTPVANPRPRLVDYLSNTLAGTMKLQRAWVDARTPLEQYGIDSITVVRLTERLEEDFGTLPKTLFCEYQTLDELGGYFLDSYPDAVARLLDDLGATEGPHPGTESGAPLAGVPAPVPAGEDPPPPRTPTRPAGPAAAGQGRRQDA